MEEQLRRMFLSTNITDTFLDLEKFSRQHKFLTPNNVELFNKDGTWSLGSFIFQHKFYYSSNWVNK